MEYKIGITGSSGFVGSYLLNFLYSNLFRNIEIYKIKKGTILISNLDFSCSHFVHLAGKAHDIKNVSDPSEYYEINYELTKKVYDAFLASEAKVFITLSSVKAVADTVVGQLTEEAEPNPLTHYGKSKLLAEQYIFSKPIPFDKRVYVLRPCMIHGPGNKGNLGLLYKFASKQIPWPLAAFENKRSFCSIDNLCFIIKELIERDDMPSGIFNVADDESVSTNELIQWMAQSQKMKPILLPIPKLLIKAIAQLGDKFSLPLNSERLQKLTESYLVSNRKLMNAIGKPMPFSAKAGLMKTFKAFKLVQ